MPYILGDKHKRDLRLGLRRPQTAGELNYCITQLCIDFIEIEGKSYSTLNEVVGAMECAKQEFYRRMVVPYEETKRGENGDVFEQG